MPSKIVDRLEAWNESVNDKIADSWFGRYFRLDGSGGSHAAAPPQATDHLPRTQEGSCWR